MRTINQDKQPLPEQSAFSLGQELKTLKKKMISGLVTSIVDGNTFEISVHVKDNIRCIDKYTAIVRIHGMDKPSTSTLSGILAKLELEKKIIGHTVECEIMKTNSQNQLIAIIPEKYLNSKFLFSIQNQS